MFPYEVDTEIVRGLDYYTKTVFEFVNEDGFTLCGGGRYDNLVHEIDGKVSMPSVLLRFFQDNLFLRQIPDDEDLQRSGKLLLLLPVQEYDHHW